MWNNSRFHEAADIVRMEHFYLDSNRRIYHRVAGMISAGRPVDIITLVDELTHHHELDAIGGRAYLCIPDGRHNCEVAYKAEHARIVTNSARNSECWVLWASGFSRRRLRFRH